MPDRDGVLVRFYFQDDSPGFHTSMLLRSAHTMDNRLLVQLRIQRFEAEFFHAYCSLALNGAFNILIDLELFCITT